MTTAPIVAIQMDPIDTLNAKSDSTVVLALEAQKRGYQLYGYHPSSLCMHGDGTLTASATKLQMQDPTLHDVWYHAEAPERLRLNDAAVVLMRQDPPFDMEYITATHLLERILPDTVVTNHPSHVRNAPEKLFPLDFAQYMPETIATNSADEVLRFLAEHEDIILKPLHGFGGHSIFRLRRGGDNVNALLETLMSVAKSETMMAQRFLPEVSDGDRRILLIDGKVEGVLGRHPAEGEIRANLRVGGTGSSEQLSPKQQEICDMVGEACRAKDLIFVGLDLIGDYLTEINVTSPTGLRSIKELDGTSPEVAVWDAIEKRL